MDRLAVRQTNWRTDWRVNADGLMDGLSVAKMEMRTNTEGLRHWRTGGWTDGRTDGLADKLKDRLPDRRTDGLSVNRRDGHRDRLIEGLRDWWIDWRTDSCMDWWSDEEMDWPKNWRINWLWGKQADGQTDGLTQTDWWMACLLQRWKCGQTLKDWDTDGLVVGLMDCLMDRRTQR